MPSLAEQDELQLGGTWSVLTRQRRDHVRLETMLRELETASAADQPQLLERLYRLVFPHAFAEEAVLWPTIRRVLPDGDALTLQVEREHQEINELVARLDRLQPDDPARRPLLDRLVRLLREDVRDEEDTLLPRLQEALSPVELRRLGVAWEAVRRTAPTRAHPAVSRRPPGQTLAALPLTLLDRTRDVVDGAARRSGRMGPALGTASRTLGAWASGIERLSVMRAGERPETRVQEDR